jgi:very-short-patch-repair endonuclease
MHFSSVSDMKLFLALLIVLTAISIIAFILLAGRTPQAAYRNRPVMTPNEIEFFGRIKGALPGMHVCPQVAMHALIEATSTNSQTRLIDFRRISQKVVDYAIFDMRWNLVAIIELDDRTHLMSRDAFRDRLTSAAGIRTLRYQSRAKPIEAQIAADVRAVQNMAVPTVRLGA